MKFIKIIKDFLSTDIWRIRLRHHSGPKKFFVKYLRVVLRALRGFNEDKCQLRSSALTFYSLLSIVPVLAMAFGIAKGFGFEKILEKQILEKVQGQEEVVARMIAFANTMLENTKGGLIAGVGVALLFWTVVKVLGNIEESFNEIWGVKHARSFARKLSDYLTIILICPLLFIISSSATVIVSSKIETIAKMVASYGVWSGAIMTITNIVPYVVVWFLFTFIYKIMPNTKVGFGSALIAGVIAGTVYQITQTIYVSFQVGVANYNAIYGSFAALPLFLVWLQLSWRIVLLGAEISFAHQNVDTYELEPDCLSVSYSFKRRAALAVMSVVVKGFHKGENPLCAHDIAHKLDIPIRLAQQVLFDLTQAGLLCETKGESEKDSCYQPARDIEVFTIKYVIDSLEGRGSDVLVVDTVYAAGIDSALEAFSAVIANLPQNKLIRDI